jgi:hypothetical protein
MYLSPAMEVHQGEEEGIPGNQGKSPGPGKRAKAPDRLEGMVLGFRRCS